MIRISNLNVAKFLRFRPEATEIFGSYDRSNGVKGIGDFVSAVERLSARYVDEVDPDKVNVFKGDLFEIFAEGFFKLNHAHPCVGLTDYEPIPLSDDYGVDGKGVNANGDRCVVQAKYRSNPTDQITYEDLAKTYASGECRLGYDLSKPNTIFLLTTCNGVRGTVHEVFGSRVRVIHRDIIAGLVDDDQTFWHDLEEGIVEAIEPV